MRNSVLFSLLALTVFSAQSLYFILEGAQTKCFIEEIPRETTVEGGWGEEIYICKLRPCLSWKTLFLTPFRNLVYFRTLRIAGME